MLLRYNRITDDGALYIGKLLGENTTIIKLNLMCNDIGPQGAEYIGFALEVGLSLRL